MSFEDLSFEDFSNYIKSLDENMTIGIHGIGEGRIVQSEGLLVEDIAKMIMDNGFKLSGEGGVLSTIYMFGQVKDLCQEDLARIYNYYFTVGKDDQIINILFGFPETIINSNGDEFFLGHFPKSDDLHAKCIEPASTDLPLNQLFDVKKKVPIDFIIGYTNTHFFDSSFQLITNDHFYGKNNSQEFNDKLYQLLIKFFYYRKVFGVYNNVCNIYEEQREEYLRRRNIRR